MSFCISGFYAYRVWNKENLELILRREKHLNTQFGAIADIYMAKN